MSDETKQMTTPTHDPAIEQEAERMLREMESRQFKEFKRIIANHGEPLNLPDVLREDLLEMLRELATLRRGAAEPSLHETIAGITTLRKERDEALAFKTYVHQRLDQAGVPTHPDGKHSREGCRVGDRLDILVERAAAKPLSDAKLREIEERAAKATKGPFLVVHMLDGNGEEQNEFEWQKVDDQSWSSSLIERREDAEFYANALADIDTLLAALRSRGRSTEVPNA